MARLAAEPPRMGRLQCGCWTHELGHMLAFAVERGKIAAATGPPRPRRIAMGFVEPGLAGAALARLPRQSALRGFERGPPRRPPPRPSRWPVSRAGETSDSVDPRRRLEPDAAGDGAIARDLCPAAALRRSAGHSPPSIDGLALATAKGVSERRAIG